MEDAKDRVEKEPGDREKDDTPPRGTLILLRHGQSQWNRKPDDPDAPWRYAGSIDVPLSEVGVQEALDVGLRLAQVPIDLIFCSQLDRTRTTISLAMSRHTSGRTPLDVAPASSASSGPPVYPGISSTVEDSEDGSSSSSVQAASAHDQPQPYPDLDLRRHLIPVYRTPALNERHFGVFQGLSSAQHETLCSPRTLACVRNEFHTPYPAGESSAQVYARVLPFFQSEIEPQVLAGRTVLVCAHGFVIRTLIKHLEGMSDVEWDSQMALEKAQPTECRLLAPTGVPLIYDHDDVGTTTCAAKVGFRKRRQSLRDRSESLSRTSAPY